MQGLASANEGRASLQLNGGNADTRVSILILAGTLHNAWLSMCLLQKEFGSEAEPENLASFLYVREGDRYSHGQWQQ
jgi:hypothetical protein